MMMDIFTSAMEANQMENFEIDGKFRAVVSNDTKSNRVVVGFYSNECGITDKEYEFLSALLLPNGFEKLEEEGMDGEWDNVLYSKSFQSAQETGEEWEKQKDVVVPFILNSLIALAEKS